MLMKSLYFLVAAASTLLLIWSLQPIAVKIGLVDRPRGHKRHHGNVPLVGGLAMFGGFWTTVLAFDVPCPNKLSFGVASSLLIIVGAWDDYRPLSSWIRLIFQCLAALILIIGGGVIIESFGDILGFGEIVLNRWLAISVTLIAIVGVINAINMIDGLDGLAGGLVGVLLLCLTALTAATDSAGYHLVLLILIGVTSAFLIFNLPLSAIKKSKIFMGDSGSTFLGLAVAWLLISLSQKPHDTITPVIALWLLIVPLFDTVALLLRRATLGLSPFTSSRDHLHHILQLQGYSPRQTLAIIIASACLFSLIGILDYYMNFPLPLLFYGFIGLFACYYYVTYRISLELDRNQRSPYQSIPQWRRLPSERSNRSEKPMQTD